eukprot:766710-Hanusia_phi.AAC.7
MTRRLEPRPSFPPPPTPFSLCVSTSHHPHTPLGPYLPARAATVPGPRRLAALSSVSETRPADHSGPPSQNFSAQSSGYLSGPGPAARLRLPPPGPSHYWHENPSQTCLRY